MAETGVVLQVSSLRVETIAGDAIVDDVAFELTRGEVLALVGESGCGKTTTALALMGHARSGARIAAGSVTLGATSVISSRSARLRDIRGEQIAYVPQDPAGALDPRLRIGAQIAEAMTAHGSARARALARVTMLAESVGLPATREFLRRYPFELSGGQQQRVAIAIALACDPLVIVLDEPTTGLDVTTQARVLELLRGLRHVQGAAFVYVTHDLAVVNELADRVAVMYAGRIVEIGAREDVLRRPAHPYTALLMGAIPRLAARTRLTSINGTAPAPGMRGQGCSFAPRCPLVIPACVERFPDEVAVAPLHTARCLRPSELRVAASASTPVERGAELVPLLAVTAMRASHHGTEVLSGVDLAVTRGECVALVGESGSGKTTLGRCIAGLHRPDAGSLTLDGAPLAAHARDRTQEQRRAVQIVFQNPDRSLNPARTVADQVSRPLRLFGFSSARNARDGAAELLERVRLPISKLDRYPRELSGGERQRVAIARALAASPSLLICDEITSALDVSIQAAIVEVMEGLREDGLTLLFITHNLALVRSVADQVVVLKAGAIRERGAVSQVIDNPEDQYTRELISAAPDLAPASQP
jgi:oligopeptide/dipeptide ABC transporter ATP-binding protein